MVWKFSEYRILYHKTNKEASTELCSVVKHLGSGRALKKWGKTLDCVSCFPLHFLRALPLPACFTTEQSTVEASLFFNYFQVTLNSTVILSMLKIIQNIVTEPLWSAILRCPWNQIKGEFKIPRSLVVENKVKIKEKRLGN